MTSAQNPLEKIQGGVARCDWYDAAIPGVCHRAVVEGLSAELSARPTKAAPVRGYQSVVQLVDTGEGVQETRAFVMWDHPKSPDRVYVSGNGPSGGVVRRFLVDNGLDHEVARYDSAVDVMMSERSFSYRFGMLQRFGSEKSKTPWPMGTREHGRTLMLNRRVKEATGSRNTKLPEAQTVFYEKGKQLAVCLEWKRIECRLRPQKPEAKAAASLLEPLDVWGAFTWTSEVLRIATAGELVCSAAAYPRFRMSLPDVQGELRRIRAMRTLEHMAGQYRRTYETLREIMGEDEADAAVLRALKGSRDPSEPSPQDAYAALYELPAGAKLQ